MKPDGLAYMVHSHLQSRPSEFCVQVLWCGERGRGHLDCRPSRPVTTHTHTPSARRGDGNYPRVDFPGGRWAAVFADGAGEMALQLPRAVVRCLLWPRRDSWRMLAAAQEVSTSLCLTLAWSLRKPQ